MPFTCRDSAAGVFNPRNRPRARRGRSWPPRRGSGRRVALHVRRRARRVAVLGVGQDRRQPRGLRADRSATARRRNSAAPPPRRRRRPRRTRRRSDRPPGCAASARRASTTGVITASSALRSQVRPCQRKTFLTVCWLIVEAPRSPPVLERVADRVHVEAPVRAEIGVLRRDRGAPSPARSRPRRSSRGRCSRAAPASCIM